MQGQRVRNETHPRCVQQHALPSVRVTFPSPMKHNHPFSFQGNLLCSRHMFASFVPPNKCKRKPGFVIVEHLGLAL